MFTFLFWNIGKKPLTDSIVRLCHRHNVDMLMLAESKIVVGDLLFALNNVDVIDYHYLPDKCEKITIYSRYSKLFVRSLLAAPSLTIRSINRLSQPQLTVAVVHLPSKLFFTENSQFAEAMVSDDYIRTVEQQAGHTRTLLVGDFNMNPFESGMVSAKGFHAVMTRDIAGKQDRTIQSQTYPFFYNPMWSHFGDGNAGPAGTFYYEKAEHQTFFWNMFDQVLLRPALLEVFDNSSLQILESDGTISLTTRTGKPDSKLASDHLPILFRLKW